jgi:phosphomannomutase
LPARFDGRLAFGTAGLRGLMGVGTQRMNRLVVQETTFGLGLYLRAQASAALEQGVVIGYDGRHQSTVFAHDAASVLAGLGIRVHLFQKVSPTPLVAFAVKHLGVAAGVMITASHNPPQYNGYKVYGANGAQIIAPIDVDIAACIERAASMPLPSMPFDECVRKGLVCAVSEDVWESYFMQVQALRPQKHVRGADRVTLAYTPLHGVGAYSVKRVLADAGFTHVHVVSSQEQPDGDFPTVDFPNPEEPGAMDAVLALAQTTAAHVAFANDPDADRLGVAVPTREGGWRALSGDSIGVLLAEYLVRQTQGPCTVATTVVSSQMLQVMARSLGVECYETLTGFKWIANEAMAREKQGLPKFVFGYEEALGYTVGPLVRDKDGVSALVAFAAIVAECLEQGITVEDRLESLYRRYGLFLTTQKTIVFDTPMPRSGNPWMARLRSALPTHIAGIQVVETKDYDSNTTIRDGVLMHPGLPKSDMVAFFLADGSRVIVRPSGTEPKLKCYYEIREQVLQDETYAVAYDRAVKRLNALKNLHELL